MEFIEADSIEEVILNTDGAGQLTEAWPRRVPSAVWGAIVFGVSPDCTHRRLLRAACLPCMINGQFSTSQRLRQQLQSDSFSKKRNPALGCGVSVG